MMHGTTKIKFKKNLKSAIFYFRNFEEAFYVSLRYSTFLECLEFDIHWYIRF